MSDPYSGVAGDIRTMAAVLALLRPPERRGDWGPVGGTSAEEAP